MNPWIIVGVLLWSVALAGGSYVKGSHDKENAIVAKLEKEKNEAIAKEIASSNKLAAKDQADNLKTVHEIYQAQLQEARRHVRIIKEVQTNTVYTDRNCSIPDSGLQLIRDAAGGKDSTLSAGDSNGEGGEAASGTR